MVSIKSISDKLLAISEVLNNMEEIVSEVTMVNSEELVSLNRDQMLYGRDAEGNEFTPSYLNDPYFKTPEKAKKYAEYKEKLLDRHNALIEHPGLFPEKNLNTPNLIVTGPFQDALYIDTGEKTYTIGSKYSQGSAINDKYNNKVFGHSDAAKNYFFNYYIRTYLLKKIYEASL